MLCRSYIPLWVAKTTPPTDNHSFSVRVGIPFTFIFPRFGLCIASCMRTSLTRSRLSGLRQIGTTSKRPLRVLGLESSADDACAAVVSSERRILSNVVCRQHDINAQYGGIHPIKAQEAHMRDMVGTFFKWTGKLPDYRTARSYIPSVKGRRIVSDGA